MFSFSRKERWGIIGLLLVIFILIIAGKLIPFFIPAQKTDFSKWESEVKTYLAEAEKIIPGQKTAIPESFDPNTIDSVSLTKMGISQKVAGNWVRYLSKGGRFREKEDIKKIFGMTSALYGQLDSFIVITAQSTSQLPAKIESSRIKSEKGFRSDALIQRSFVRKDKENVGVQELNSTDSIRLLSIPGIGSVLASRIIRYRNLLGGFYSVSQIREVYGIRDDNFQMVSPYLTVDPSVVRTFNINFSVIGELGHHPYIGYKTAKRLLRLRDIKGKFLAPEDLAPVVTSDSLKRLVPYLKFS